MFTPTGNQALLSLQEVLCKQKHDAHSCCCKVPTDTRQKKDVKLKEMFSKEGFCFKVISNILPAADRSLKQPQFKETQFKLLTFCSDLRFYSSL